MNQEDYSVISDEAFTFASTELEVDFVLRGELDLVLYDLIDFEVDFGAYLVLGNDCWCPFESVKEELWQGDGLVEQSLRTFDWPKYEVSLVFKWFEPLS